jgi:alkane 1-monooxygenase
MKRSEPNTVNIEANAEPGTKVSKHSAPIQWRFALLFLVIIGPVFLWPIAAKAGSAPWQTWAFWLPLFSVHCLIPALDLFLGADNHPAVEGKTRTLNRVLPALCLPAWLLVVLIGCYIASFELLSTLDLVGIVLSLGSMGAVLAINPAHELIHRNSSLERNVGGLLLAAVGYGAFKVEHVRGHHLYAATSKDTASAEKGDSVFAFIVRSFLGTMINAHALENQRLKRIGLRASNPQWWLKNEIVRWNGVSVLLAIGVAVTLGPVALLVFVLAGLGAIFELEVINYIEHYGLRRKTLENGRYEPVKEQHSWNTNTLGANVFLFNLQRHSDHHAHAGKDYLHLSSIASAPQLPFGYSVMFLVALCPPLWRKLMDHRIPT